MNDWLYTGLHGLGVILSIAGIFNPALKRLGSAALAAASAEQIIAPEVTTAIAELNGHAHAGTLTMDHVYLAANIVQDNFMPVVVAENPG